jgi:hypothetical protein
MIGTLGCAAAMTAFACATTLAQVPDNLKPPANERVVLKVTGKGTQIYKCQNSQWVLEKPKADLIDEHGNTVGRHYEGPTWEAIDGSKAVGEVEQRADAPSSKSIPWLLLKAKSTQGPGILAGVTHIQRVETSGGAAPATGCDQTHLGQEVSIEYRATYIFFK